MQLAGYVREVFGAQITRRFVHAFTICGPFLRCYLFDRVGISISERINITKNDRTQKIFTRILQAYVSMDAVQLGFNENYEYIRSDDNKGTVSMPSPEAPRPQFLTLGGKRFMLRENLYHRPVIVSRATICWLAEDLDTKKECVIKDSWRASWRTPEGDLLALAHQRGVFAISTPIVYGNVTVQCGAEAKVDTIDHVRRYLSYDGANEVVLKFKRGDALHWLGSSLPTIQVVMSSGGVSSRNSQMRSAIVMADLRSERKMARLRPASAPVVIGKRPARSEEKGDEERHRKVQKRGSTHHRGSKPNRLRAVLPRDCERSDNAASVNSVTKSIASPNTVSQSPSRDSNSTTRFKAPEKKEATSSSLLSGQQTTEYITSFDQCSMYMDMTHAFIVTNLVGKKIEKFATEKELLEGMRDAIKCHQSLLQSARILHRDISPNNILLYNPEESDTLASSDLPKGFLIDLDLAKYVGPNTTTPSYTLNGVRRRTGTMLFMAIEILMGTCSRHCWRHDLESFLYVLIWCCVSGPDGANKADKKELESIWSTGDSASVKLNQVSQRVQWVRLMELFATSMKGGAAEWVVNRWRDILFPIESSGMGVVTGEEGMDREQVYEDMLAAVDIALGTSNAGTRLNETGLNVTGLNN
ncbi:hypothetical protein BGX38DRAFT_488982 [Terfezia claveryi]|nr:hypothetical protein BGX38DRAFT_488982 [Terfezia claveryi]